MPNSVQRSIRLTPKTTNELNRLTGNSGEIFFDASALSLRLFTGKHAGGYSLLKADLSNLETTGGLDVDFGNKVLIAGGFQGPLAGNVTGNVTGQVSDITNHMLSELSDVAVSSATDGQVLYYDSVAQMWKPTTLSSSFNGGTITSQLIINNTAQSSSTASGALYTQGGLGVAKDMYLGGTLNVASGGAITGNLSITGDITTVTNVTATASISVNNRGSLKLFDANNSNYIALQPPANVVSDITFVLPGSAGTAGQVLTTNGAGVMSWSSVSGGSGGGSSNPPGGSTGYVQFNDNNNFGGVGTFTYDAVLDIVNVHDLTASNNITGNIISTSVTITGGSIDGTALGTTTQASAKVTTLAASDTAAFTKGAASTSTTTGTVVVTGGIGISQDVNIGGGVQVNTTITTGSDVTVGGNVYVSNLPTVATQATNKQYVDSRAIAMSVALG